MQEIEFYKYQGTGNDFILLNGFKNSVQLNSDQVSQLCNRHFGIGADGLIQLLPKQGYDFEMLYYNADGNVSTMCGNGGRCAVQFANHQGIEKTNYEFWAADGLHNATIVDNQVILGMQSVNGIQQLPNHAYTLNTGSPHYVQQAHNIQNLDVKQAGSAIRNSAPYVLGGINVNFYEVLGTNQIYVRTYERGVEDETLSCGTGVTAAALVYLFSEKKTSTDIVHVQTLGGALQVTAMPKVPVGNYVDITLQGAATFVFSGSITI